VPFAGFMALPSQFLLLKGKAKITGPPAEQVGF
jgi:hypothetical protein